MPEPSAELDNLARIGKLTREQATATEIEGLIRSGDDRLTDAKRPDLALASRFDLAYNAAHAFSLAALRRLGFRSENRYLVFQVLPHTLGIPVPMWRVLAKAHEVRNRTEYEGDIAIDAALLRSLLSAADTVREALKTRLKVADK